MAAVWQIVRKDLLRGFRNRTLLLFGVVAPLVLAAALGAVFGGLDEQITITLGVVDDGDRLADVVVDQVLPVLTEDGLVNEVVLLSDDRAATAAVDDGAVDAAVVFAGNDAEVVGHADRPTSAGIAEAIVSQAATEFRVAERALAAGSVAAGGVPDVDGILAAVDATDRVTLETTPVGVAPLDNVTAVAAGISVFFLFFAVSIAVTGLLEEEQQRTLARLRTAPIPAWAPLAAKAVGALVVGVVSLVVLAVATTFLLGADWGAPGPLLLVIVAAVAAATGIVAAIASFARTPEAALGSQSVVSTVLGALGGSFFPIAGGGLLATVSLLAPHSWFLRGVRQVAGDAPFGDVLTTTSVLLLMALVTGAVATLNFRRTLGA